MAASAAASSSSPPHALTAASGVRNAPPLASGSAPPASAASTQGVGAGKAALQLPENCKIGLLTPAGQSILVCQAPPDPWLDKLLPAVPSLVISIVAIVLSLRTQSYTRTKDLGARAQSIQDDFWIRKVVAPTSIEPFLKYINELPSNLPVTGQSTDLQVQAYWIAQVEKMAQFSVAFHTLALVDATLDQVVAENLGKFEDVLATYCGELRQHISTGSPAPDRNAAVVSAAALGLEILRPIQRHQARLGTT